MLKSLTHSGPRAVSGDSRCSSWSLLATTRSLSRGSHTQARCGVTAAIAGAAVAAPGAAGLTIWAEVTAAAGAAAGAAAAGAADAGAAGAGAAGAAAAAAAEPAPLENLCRQASRLILLLSLSGRFLLFLGVTLAAAAAAGVAVLQYRLASTLILYLPMVEPRFCEGDC